MIKLSGLQAEKDRLERELKRIRGSADKETDRYLKENSELKAQYSKLEGELRTIEFEQAEKEKIYREELAKKREELNRLQNIIDVAHSTQQILSAESSETKRAALKMQRNQMKLLHRAKDLCTEHLQQVLREETERQTREQSDQLALLEKSLSEEMVEKARNERRCQQLLNAVWSMRDDIDHPDITPENFVQRLPELKQYVEDALDYHRKVAVKELKSEVKTAIPDIEFSEGETVAESVQRYINSRVGQKESEYQRVLQRGEEREKRLRQKLQDSMRKVKQMQSYEKQDSEDELMASLDQMKSEWDLKKRQLDEKMRQLKTSSVRNDL